MQGIGCGLISYTITIHSSPWGGTEKNHETLKSKQPASGPRIQPNSLKYESSLQQQHLFAQHNFININNFMICNAHIKMAY
jgi:hypothetical protein